MRVFLLTIALSLLLAQQSFSQVHEEDLIGTWFPLGVRQIDKQYYHNQSQLLLVFEKDGSGVRKGTGGNIYDSPFTYKYKNDSIEWNFEGNISKSNKPLFSDSIMTLDYDASYVMDFIRLPQIDAGIQLSELKEALENQTWEMTITSKRGHGLSILYQFEDHVLDSGLTDYRLFERDLGLRSYQNGIVDAIRQSWSVTQHGTTLILGIDREFSSMGSFTLLLQSFHADSMLFSIWDENGEHEVKMKKMKKLSQKQSKKQLNRLTKHKWRFHSKYIPPPEPIDTANIMYLSMVKGDFIEDSWYPPNYLKDSTLLVTQQDLDNRLLVLNFTATGKYTIYRDERLLDEGNWRYLFNETVLELTSEKEAEMSDGVFGGTLQIISLKSNEMKLYRQTEGFLNHEYYYYPYSYLETYKSDKKEK